MSTEGEPGRPAERGPEPRRVSGKRLPPPAYESYPAFTVWEIAWRAGESFENETTEERNERLDIDSGNTEALIETVLAHGMTVERGAVLNSPNEQDFRDVFGLDSADIEAIRSYKGASARSFNHYLRGRSRSVYPREHFARLLSLFGENGRLPQTQGGEVLYRGLTADLASGAPIHERGFMSTSVSGGVGAGFARTAKKFSGSGYLARLVLPEGVRFLPVGAGEKEVILQPGLVVRPAAIYDRATEAYRSILSEVADSRRDLDIDGIFDGTVEVVR